MSFQICIIFDIILLNRNWVCVTCLSRKTHMGLREVAWYTVCIGGFPHLALEDIKLKFIDTSSKLLLGLVASRLHRRNKSTMDDSKHKHENCLESFGYHSL